MHTRECEEVEVATHDVSAPIELDVVNTPAMVERLHEREHKR